VLSAKRLRIDAVCTLDRRGFRTYRIGCKALRLVLDDCWVVMGWGETRQGNPPEARELIRHQHYGRRQSELADAEWVTK
jgi:hypothetical protein